MWPNLQETAVWADLLKKPLIANFIFCAVHMVKYGKIHIFLPLFLPRIIAAICLFFIFTVNKHGVAKLVIILKLEMVNAESNVQK